MWASYYYLLSNKKHFRKLSSLLRDTNFQFQVEIKAVYSLLLIASYQ